MLLMRAKKRFFRKEAAEQLSIHQKYQMSKFLAERRSATLEVLPKHFLDLRNIFELDSNSQDKSSMFEDNGPQFHADEVNMPSYMKQLFFHIHAIRSGVDNLQQSVALLHEKSENVTKSNTEEHVELFDMSAFPLDSPKDVEDLERIFTENPEAKKILARQLSHVGGNGVSDTCRRLMRKTMADSLAQTYSYLGYKTKKSFSSLQLKDVLLDAIKLNKSISCTEKEVETVFQDWLRHAKFRLTRKKD